MKDAQIKKLIAREEKRQKKAVNLIASENYVSKDVREALGSVLTNKYAEGYPGARYYGGNEVVDKVEELARERALKLYTLNPSGWSVNVQPLSGSPANLAVYLALVPPGEKVMGMSLAMGGHLTHGHTASATGKLWRWVHYGVDKKTERLDYDAILKLAKREKPKLIVCGFTAYSRTIDFKRFRKIADAVHAYLMVDMSHIAGLVAGGAHPSPFPYADVVTTTTHKTLRGPRAALIFARKSEILISKSETNSKLSAKGGSLPEVATSLQAGASGGKTQNSKPSIAEAVDKAVFPGLQGGPHMNTIAAVAVALKEASTPAFRKYARQVVRNAQALAHALTRLGWRVVSGGTDTHLFLMDTMAQGIPGKLASEKLERAGIIVNKNTIPFDARKPMDPSGIRIGTAAVTTRGMDESGMRRLARRIDIALRK